MIGTTRLPPQPCPTCGKQLDACTPASSDLCTPKPNDYTICLGCQQILQFDAAMILHKRSFEEVDDQCKAQIARAVYLMRVELPRIKAMDKARRN